MQSIVGFTVFSSLPENRLKALESAHRRALQYFPRLQRRSYTIGATCLELWGREGMDERIHTLPDGSFLALIGSPHGDMNLANVQDALLANRFELPWDGRVILLRISADGKRWTLWNDWLGSIPVFHAEIGHGRIASTLEPVVVASAAYTPDDFFLPGLVSLLINGHFISDWTLYKGMKVIPPDSRMEWGEAGFRAERLWTVVPSQSRWEAGWDDLVDEMYELSRKAIAEVLKTQLAWIVPLSAGLDSRLIAGVGAEIGAEMLAYAWGEPDSTDVVYSRKIAKTLGIPWKWIELNEDFLVTYTPRWADLFGSSMHFHGMYQMNFLDSIPEDMPLISGFLGDALSGSNSVMQVEYKGGAVFYKRDWYLHWGVEELSGLMKDFPLEEVLLELANEVKQTFTRLPGAEFSKNILLALWSRQRFFTSFQSNLISYWSGVATPFLNRAYARFSLSLPRAVFEHRRLLGDVFRRYYGKLAVIPGTYGSEPFIRTGRYILRRRIVEHLPALLHHGPFAGFDDVPLRMDIDCVQAVGKQALWPLFDTLQELSRWLDVCLLEREYQALQHSSEDIRPLRRLQSVQTLAYRLRADGGNLQR
ncbi:MAG TPA: hypothetical protein VNK49_07590 [Anaerolineales bacterium]|nr:hypothetical protein [Anaerolineales bacterium]